MKSLLLVFACIVLFGCSDNKKELEALQRKHEESLAKLQAELWELQNSDKRAFADAISKPSSDQRYEALKQFIIAYPSSPLVADARKEIQNLEKLIAKIRKRDQEMDRSLKIASQREQQWWQAEKEASEREHRRKEAEEEAVRQKRIAEKIRSVDLVRKGIANLQELNTALMGMNEFEVISLIDRPDRVEQKREFYYYRGLGIETATGKKRGIIITFGGGTSLQPRVTMVRWRI